MGACGTAARRWRGRISKKGRPAEKIAGLADDLGVGLAVVGSRGLGAVKRLAVGSVSEGVVLLSPCPVLVMRGGEGAWPPSLPAPRGGGRACYGLLQPHAREPGRTHAYDAQARRASGEAWGALSRLAGGLEDTLGTRPESRAVLGGAAAVLQGAAEEDEGPALVVVGSRGRGAVTRFALGSVSMNVLRAVGGPVLIVRAPEEP